MCFTAPTALKLQCVAAWVVCTGSGGGMPSISMPKLKNPFKRAAPANVGEGCVQLSLCALCVLSLFRFAAESMPAACAESMSAACAESIQLCS